MKKDCAGFSYIELIAVMAMVLLVINLIFNNVNLGRSSYKLENETMKMLSIAQLLQQESIYGKKDTRRGENYLEFKRNRYRVAKRFEGDWQNLPEGITAIKYGSYNNVYFYHDGRPAKASNITLREAMKHRVNKIIITLATGRMTIEN